MMTSTPSTVTHRFHTTSWGMIPVQTSKPLAESNKTEILRNLAKSEVTPKTVAQTKDILEQQGETEAADVVQVAEILRQTSQLQNISQKMATDVLKIVDSVSKLNQSVLQQSNSVGNITNTMIMAVEQLADQIILKEGNEVHLETNTTVLKVWNLTAASPSPFLGLQLPTEGEIQNVTSASSNQSDPDTYASMDTAILLPGEVGRQIVEKNRGRDVRISASVMTLTSLFHTDGATDDRTDQPGTGGNQSREPGREEEPGGVMVISKVVSLRVTVDGQPLTDLSDFDHGHVTTVFTPLKSVQQKTASWGTGEPQCVFWDFAGQQGRGQWSDEGCFLKDRVLDKLVCVCNHLTNFAVIMKMYSQDEWEPDIHEHVLSYISVVGLMFSICGLSVTIFAFIVVRKLHSSLPQQTLFNMALAMLLSWVTFLAGIQRVEDHVTCVAVAMLLHYFILTSFLWMLAQGVLHYVMLVKGRKRPFTHYLLKAALPAWGLPLLPPVIISAVNVDLYRGGQRYCWMSLMAFYYGFLAPVAIIVAINIVIYVLVVVSICRRSNIGTGGKNYTAIGLRASVSCFVVQGLSWVFAFFALEDARLVFQYLFTITTSFQGLLIFSLYTAREPAVRAFCINMFRRGHSASAPEQDRPAHPQPVPNTAPTKETSFIQSQK